MEVSEDYDSSDEDALNSKLPPLPGHKDHSCTDTACLVVFISALAVQAAVGFYAYSHGDIRKVVRGYDYKGRICGLDVPGRLLFHCLGSAQEFDMVEPVCVDTCPGSARNTTTSCFNPVVGTEVEYPDYDSHQVLEYCLPRDSELRSKFLLEKLSNSTQIEPSPQQALHAIERLAVEALAKLKNAWLAILLSANVAAAIGYAYLLLLDSIALPLIYVAQFCVVGGSWAVGIYLIQGEVESVDSLDDLMRDEAFLVGCLCIFVGLAALCYFTRVNRHMSVASGCIKATCECMFEEPTVLLEPFLSLSIKVMIIGFFSWTLVSLISCGELVIPHYSHNGWTREFQWTLLQKASIVFTFWMLLWCFELNHALTHYSLAWTTQMWYFTPYVDNGQNERVKLDKKGCGVMRAYASAVRYHIGSLALGAFFFILFRPARVMLAPLAKAASSRKNFLSRGVGSMCSCFVSWYWMHFAKLRKSAYMDVAVTSSDFCRAADRSFDIMSNEVPSFNIIDGPQMAFGATLIGLTSVAGFFSTFAMVKGVPAFTSSGSSFYVEDKLFVALVGGVISGIVGINFMVVFDTVGHTIMFCYAMEQRRHRLIDHMKYHEEEDQSYFGWFVRDTSAMGPQESRRVEYAPDQFRSLVQEVESDAQYR